MATTAGVLGDSGFKACGVNLKEVFVVYKSYPSSIKLKAEIFDVIKSIASPQPIVKLSNKIYLRGEAPAAQCKWLMEVSASLPFDQPYPSGECFFPDVLAGTLIADLDLSGDMSMVAHFLNFYAAQYIGAETEILHEGVPTLVEVTAKSICLEVEKRCRILVSIGPNRLSPVEVLAKLGNPPCVPNHVLVSAAMYAEHMSTAIIHEATREVMAQRRVYTTRDG
jgi:hypothetical protein